MIFAPINSRSVTYATSRLRDFVSVQRQNSREQRKAALEAVALALGFGDDQRKQLVNEISDYIDPDYVGFVLLGAVLGLYMAEHETDLADSQLWSDCF